MKRFALMALSMVVLAAPLSSAAPAARAKGKTHHVHAEGSWPMRFSFNPSEVEIAAGDKVVWMNSTSAEHHIQPYAGPWENESHLHLDPDTGKAAYVFKKPGEYKYYCDLQLHGQLLPGDICVGQCGTITVN